MKKILALSVFILLTFATSALAADVVITITIPDAAVARVSAMVTADLNCGKLNAKECLKKEIVRHIRYLVKTYEAGLIIKQSKDDVDAITDAAVQ